MTPDTPAAELMKRALTRRSYQLSEQVSKEVLKTAGVEVVADMVADQMTAHLRIDMWAERTHVATSSKTFQLPASWWQMWKRDHAPAWLVRRWPVRTRPMEVKLTATAWRAYPQASLPLSGQGSTLMFQDSIVTAHWPEDPEWV